MMRNKYLVIIEIIWIVTGVLCFYASVMIAMTSGGNKVYIFAAMALVSFLFAWMRHRQRKKS